MDLQIVMSKVKQLAVMKSKVITIGKIVVVR